MSRRTILVFACKDTDTMKEGITDLKQKIPDITINFEKDMLASYSIEDLYLNIVFMTCRLLAKGFSPEDRLVLYSGYRTRVIDKLLESSHINEKESIENES